MFVHTQNHWNIPKFEHSTHLTYLLSCVSVSAVLPLFHFSQRCVHGCYCVRYDFRFYFNDNDTHCCWLCCSYCVRAWENHQCMYNLYIHAHAHAHTEHTNQIMKNELKSVSTNSPGPVCVCIICCFILSLSLYLSIFLFVWPLYP